MTGRDKLQEIPAFAGMTEKGGEESACAGMTDQSALVRLSQQHAFDRGFTGEDAGAIDRLGPDRHVADGELVVLEPLDDFFQRGAGWFRPLHLDPAGIARGGEVLFHLGEIGDPAGDVRIAALGSLG